ncbi:trihelix transcription factor ASR3 [Senna tora]|uniref:Trihelix transcription factor ASR3 n=1 Tax=Senna tora TaxID=362788 RepID=A0A834X7I6_9FABA|nr:trihelix transcription factor ASR3 [Senna tora]
MALEQQLSLGPNPNSVDGQIDGATDGVDARPASTDGGEDGSKAPRLPRWTRQEIMVLINGKRDAENQFRGGRSAGLPFGTGQLEPKWASVSSYCKIHGVNRGPVQCRKRWSNLAGDYKKIKEWESQIRDETESFWVMRNDLRRQRKLPGFFDKEVYDILDSGSQAPTLALALAPASAAATTTTTPVEKGKESRGVAAEEADADTEPHLYNSQSAAGDDGLFSDFEQEEVGVSPEKESTRKDASPHSTVLPSPIPISEKQYQPLLRGGQGGANVQGGSNEKQRGSNPEMGSTSQGQGRVGKRKRLATEGEDEILQNQLIQVLERNGKMLSAQLEAQNINNQLDREQRKDHTSNIVAVLDKLADALGRIADKL